MADWSRKAAHCRAISHLYADVHTHPLYLSRWKTHWQDIAVMKQDHAYSAFGRESVKQRHAMLRLRAGHGLTAEEYRATFFPDETILQFPRGP